MKARVKNDKERWAAAAHAVQSGVAVEIEQQMTDAHTPKHLRVGVNVAMVDHGSLVKLLIEKGVFTEAEYLKAIADGMEQEQASYESRISAALGRAITLG